MYDDNDIKDAVRERYAAVATPVPVNLCCSPAPAPAETSPTLDAREIGYTDDELAAVPDGADLGLGCGNPLAMLGLAEGETVLDLGSGGGKDCFIAAKQVGPTGRVIGVDMTPEMVSRARRNLSGSGYDNVEFRLGEIEHLPVADSSVDAIISNCVVNLVPDKRQVFADAFRVLRPGGRLSVSDIVTLGEVPPQILESVEAYVSCLAGASGKDAYLEAIADAGFSDVRVTSEQTFALEDVIPAGAIDQYAKQTGLTPSELRAAAGLFVSIRVAATKPA